VYLTRKAYSVLKLPREGETLGEIVAALAQPARNERAMASATNVRRCRNIPPNPLYGA
jgi:hypothetical protein